LPQTPMHRFRLGGVLNVHTPTRSFPLYKPKAYMMLGSRFR